MIAASGIFPTEVESDYGTNSESREEINVADPPSSTRNKPETSENHRSGKPQCFHPYFPHVLCNLQICARAKRMYLFQSQLIDDKAKKKQLQYQKSKIESVLQKPRRPSYLRNLAHNMRAITALSKSHKHLNLLCWVSHLTSSGLFCSHQWSPSESMSLSWFV